MDPTWQWCERVKENNRLKLKCSFCGNTFSGGISRMKHHLAGTSKDASPCGGRPNKPSPPFVRQQCLDMLHDLCQKRIQKEIDQANVGYNEPLEDEEEEEEAYECDDEDDSSLRTDLDTSRGRDRRGKGIMYEGGRSGITGRKRRGTADIRARRGMRPPSDRVPTGSGLGRSEVGTYQKHRSQFDPISLKNFDNLEPWIKEEPATIFDDEDLECFNLEVEATEGFVDEGESATAGAGAGAEYVGEDLPILDEEDEEEDEDDEDYE
ncbi:hypothetical protein EJ110_NYTH39862 [Nymphaea thermarum]|nr:hypothetical protein EJ110_NYTH39862 [Nymphaea thermarum]